MRLRTIMFAVLLGLFSTTAFAAELLVKNGDKIAFLGDSITANLDLAHSLPVRAGTTLLLRQYVQFYRVHWPALFRRSVISLSLAWSSAVMNRSRFLSVLPCWISN